jgi:hypothetical protein
MIVVMKSKNVSGMYSTHSGDDKWIPIGRPRRRMLKWILKKLSVGV